MNLVMMNLDVVLSTDYPDHIEHGYGKSTRFDPASS
jgi:hypothetical protein